MPCVGSGELWQTITRHISHHPSAVPAWRAASALMSNAVQGQVGMYSQPQLSPFDQTVGPALRRLPSVLLY